MTYRINGFSLSTDLRSANKKDKTISFTHQEQLALRLFLDSEDGFVDRQLLESTIWEKQIVTQNSLRKLMSELRCKFESKECIQNIRGKGYKLDFEIFTTNKTSASIWKNSKHSKYAYVTVFVLLLTSLALVAHLSLSPKQAVIPKVSTQSIFESNAQIIDYALYDGRMYVTTSGDGQSNLYEVVNRKKKLLFSAQYTGAFRGIEIHKSGKTVMHFVEDGLCKIKVFAVPVKNQIDEIPCNRQNAFPSFDWIDENKFYVTYNVELAGSIVPHIYDLETGLLEKDTSSSLLPATGEKVIDAFIKATDTGLYSLREDHLDKMSLVYFEGDNQRSIFDYRAKPYSFGLSQDHLFFVGNNNELLKLDVSGDMLTKAIEPELVLAPQAVKLDDPLILEDELYFSLGNSSSEVIRSMFGKFTHELESGIRDFKIIDNQMFILALTNTGYAVERLIDERVIETLYLDTELTLRSIAYYKGDIYLAGPSGIYIVTGEHLEPVSSLKTRTIVSNDQCMLIESDGIHIFNDQTRGFDKLAGQGERPFISNNGCSFVDNLTGNIVNQAQDIHGKQLMRKMLFEYKGKLAHWYSKGESTYIVDIESGETIAKTKQRVLFKRLASYGDDILFLGAADVNSSIIKLQFF
ncbi:winged helix-turn-helix domain-containing protein [Alteromonas gracilis]|uniref:winged helix-turn-helix domain-containing protein n=1 Tax=Alteromonas gracilis TaxID=1479524 RepID=UPI0030CC5C8E